MYNFYYEDVAKWTIAMYEKYGRAYKEIGVFFEEETERVSAFEAFSTMCNAIPTWQAVERSVEIEQQGGEIPAYEVRLIDPAGKVVALVLWDAESITKCVEDYKNRKTKKYTVTAVIEIDEEEDPEMIDWSELVETNKFSVFEISENL